MRAIKFVEMEFLFEIICAEILERTKYQKYVWFTAAWKYFKLSKRVSIKFAKPDGENVNPFSWTEEIHLFGIQNYYSLLLSIAL